MIKNITFSPDATSASPAPEPPEQTLRLRRVTLSPAEEYAIRPGTVRPIANELAAAILSRKGRAEVSAKGIVVDRTDIGGRHTYWHPDSTLCNDLSTRERKLYYVLNPHQTDIVHILDDAGRYLESLPLKDRPEVLDTAQQAKAAADNKRQIARHATRLQQLHGQDTRERLADLAANSREMQRVVQTLPAPAAAPLPPARSPHGESAAAGTRRINDIRQSHATAIALGRAISLNRQAPVPTEPPISEDWSSPLDRHHTPQPQIESW